MRGGRLDNIDGLRAVAAIAVFIQHLFGDVLRMPAVSGLGIGRAMQASVESIDLGRFGVVLFFLISGFVVPFSLKGADPVARFAVSRFFRLYPALWTAILALAAYDLASGQAVTFGTLLADATMVPLAFRAEWISPIYWTLTIELIFYVAVAALFAGRVLFRPAAIFALAVVLLAATVLPILGRTAHLGEVPVQYVTLHLSFLFTGLLLRLAILDRVREAGLSAVLLVALQLASVMAVSRFSLARGDGFVQIGPLPILAAYALAFATFAAAALSGRPLSRALGFVGRISYSFYLFHWLVCTLSYRALPLDGTWWDLRTYALCVGGTLLASLAGYALVERPAIEAGRAVGRLVGRASLPGLATLS